MDSFRSVLYKFCSCLSNSRINGQHANLKYAPDPEDINWVYLENSYLITKLKRAACYFMCFSILLFGIGSAYEITNLNF